MTSENTKIPRCCMTGIRLPAFSGVRLATWLLIWHQRYKMFRVVRATKRRQEALWFRSVYNYREDFDRMALVNTLYRKRRA